MLATIIISLLLAAVCAAVIFNMGKQKKQGKGSCGCGCKDCSMSQICHSKK